MTPELILVIAALVLLLVDAFVPKLPKRYLGYSGALVVAWALTYVLTPKGIIPQSNFWESFQPLAHYVYKIQGIILGATLLTLMMLTNFKSTVARSVTGDSRNQDGTGELYILPLLACAGMMWMVSCRDFINLFVSLELTTLSFYIMVGYMRRNVGSLEGGIKYLICGALSTGLLVFGIAWIYGTTGSFEYGMITNALYAEPMTAAKMLGVVLVTLGLLFKIGAVPMHIWVPDVYQGAPAPITAFLSVASKTAGFCVLFFFIAPFMVAQGDEKLFTLMLIVTGLTLIVGNAGAIPQTNLKRMMGYSSISHAGYLLPFILIVHTGDTYYPHFIVYLAIYGIMTYGAFFIMAMIREQSGREDLTGFKGLGHRNPRLAAVTTLFFAALAGVPLTGGFTAKFLSFVAMYRVGNMSLLVIAIIAAATGFYYYFKVIRAMYWEKADEGAPIIRVPLISAVWIAILAILTISTGLIPLMY